MNSTVATPLFDIEDAPAPRPLSASTRRALKAELDAARDRHDVITGLDIYRLAITHDEAWQDEPSLRVELGFDHDEQITEAAA